MTSITSISYNQPQGAVLATSPPSMEVKVFIQTTTVTQNKWIVSLRGANIPKPLTNWPWYTTIITEVFIPITMLHFQLPTTIEMWLGDITMGNTSV